jgi:hypothetical protein
MTRFSSRSAESVEKVHKISDSGFFYSFSAENCRFARPDHKMGSVVVPVRDLLDWDHTIQ